MANVIDRTPVMATPSFLSDKVQAVFDRALLLRAVDNQIFDRYGIAKTIPTNSNAKKGFAMRYKNVLPATTPIAEYDGTNIKRPNKIVREEVEFEVNHYGDYITLTDELKMYDFRQIQSDFLDVMGDQASLTVDTVTRDILRAGTNVVYADGGASRLAVVDGAKILTENDFKIMAVKLKNQRGKKFKGVITGSTKIGTQPVRSAFTGIVHPSQTEDLRNLTGWKNVETYADYSKSEEDEVGMIGDFRIVESTNNDPVVQTGTDTNDYNVYLGLFMAQEAYATVSLRGKKTIETIVKPVGSAGSDDPLNQYGTIGWKAYHGAVILNQKWLIRTEAIASIEDADVKHHYDHTPIA